MTTRRYLDIKSLDGLRAISIGVVFVAHAGLDRVIPGGFGVTVFFVLSGYLITTLLRIEHERDSSVSLRRFYIRRFFRILPLFYFVLLLAVVASFVGLGTGRIDVTSLAFQAGHVANYWGLRHAGSYIRGTGVYWSLAVEEHFYLAFPLFFVVLNRAGLSYRRQVSIFLAISAGVLAWRCVLVYGMHASIERTFYATDTRLDSLLLGCAAALLANPAVDGPKQSERALRAWAIGGVLVILGTLAFRDDGFRETLRYSLQSIAIVAVMRYVVAAPHSLAGRFLNWRPMVWFGQLSYAFYLVHYLVVLEIQKHTRSVPVVFTLGLLIAVPLAWLVRSIVDPPAQRWRDRVLARSMAAQAAQAAPTTA